MRNFLAVGMMLGGIFLGAYVGLWICFVGGIVDIVNNFNAGNGLGVAWGVLKFVFSGIAGYTSAALLVLPGAAMFD